MRVHDTTEAIRAKALAWIDTVTLGGTVTASRDRLANDFTVDGQRFPLIDRGRGIRKPFGWRAALSITTAAPRQRQSRPYADDEGPDGLHRYKFRRDERGTAENESLRAAMHEGLPIIWFYGVKPGVFARAERPDPDRLAERYLEFRAA